LGTLAWQRRRASFCKIGPLHELDAPIIPVKQLYFVLGRWHFCSLVTPHKTSKKGCGMERGEVRESELGHSRRSDNAGDKSAQSSTSEERAHGWHHGFAPFADIQHWSPQICKQAFKRAWPSREMQQ
jgi:hypothetical protein